MVKTWRTAAWDACHYILRVSLLFTPCVIAFKRVLLVEQNVRILSQSFNWSKVFADGFDIVVIIFEPDAVGLVFDEAIIVTSWSWVAFVDNQGVQVINMIIFTCNLLGSKLIFIESHVLGINLDLFVETQWILEFSAIIAESLHMHNKNSWKLGDSETHLSNAEALTLLAI